MPLYRLETTMISIMDIPKEAAQLWMTEAKIKEADDELREKLGLYSSVQIKRSLTPVEEIPATDSL